MNLMNLAAMINCKKKMIGETKHIKLSILTDTTTRKRLPPT